MRASIVLLFSFLALCFAQEVVVDETSDVVSDHLDLDALIAEANQAETKQTETTAEESQVPLDEPIVETETNPEVETTTAESAPSTEQSASSTNTGDETASPDAKTNEESNKESEPEQSGPFIDLLGPKLYSLKMIDENQAQLFPHYTNEVLKGKKVVGLYFSADWCGPCRKFTPELVAFYQKMNARRGHKNDFEIVWVSRCRDMQSYGQYFTHMNWLALPFEEALGKRGEMLSNKYKVKGIPTLVLLDDLGNVITTDARNKIPQDKAGIGFPWRNPLATLYTTIFPRSLRLMVKGQIDSLKGKLLQRVKGLVGLKTKTS